MRAAALALVMICGAAVVLWYANMLNSWVLGGLIGGLAALLLSIPISLALFTYLSRRHDERLNAEAQEEVSLAQVAYYKHAPVAVHESNTKALQQREDEWSENESYPRVAHASTARNLPVPSTSRLPVKRQTQQAQEIARQRQIDYPLAHEHQSNEVFGNRKVQQNQRGAALRQANGQVNYPGAYGYQSRYLRATQQSAALRTARLEAEQQLDASDSYNSGPSKRLPAIRQEENKRNSQMVSRQSKSLNSSQATARSRINSHDTPSNSAYIKGSRANSHHLLESGKYPVAEEPHTEHFQTRNANYTRGAMRQPPTQTGQLARRPRIEGHGRPRNPEIVTGSLKNPMTRRAPYMYEDDPLRQELVQKLEPPAVRRSSLFEQSEEDNGQA
jgi:hypothetical protein